jgi:hypothetical protein
MSRISLFGLKVSSTDAKRLLSPAKYEQLQLYSESEKRNCLLPWLRPDYRHLLDELRKLKHNEQVKNKFAEYEQELIIDEKAIQKSTNNQSISTHSNALTLYHQRYPKHKKLHETENTVNWVPNYNEQITSAAKAYSQTYFEFGIMEKVKHPNAFTCHINIWPIVIPQANYLRAPLPSLEIHFNPVVVCTLTIHRAEHQKTIDETMQTYPSSDKSFALNTEILSNRFLKLSEPKLVIPIELIKSLATGLIQAPGCRVIRKNDLTVTYEIIGLDNELVLSTNFLRFLGCLGGTPLITLLNLGLIDDLTYNIIENADDSIPVSPPIREKDRGYLRLIQQTEGFLTNNEWGRVLSLSREGAFRTLKRLQEADLVSLEKHVGGKGVRVTLTRDSLSALR